MTRLISPGMLADFKKELQLMKANGRLEKGAATIRQQVYLRIAAAHDLKWMIENKSRLIGELDSIVAEVKSE